MTDLRCLSLDQPWASLVAIGVKTIETRSWSTKHRGRIGIASTAGTPIDGLKLGPWTVTWGAEGWFMRDRPAMEAAKAASYVPLPRGAIVATANLVDCVPIVAGFAGIDPPCVSVGDGDTLWLRWVPANKGSWTRIDGYLGQRDELPYGDYRPGRWAWLLDDVKPTTERCPACWSECYDPAFPCTARPETRCSVCDGAGVCDPVPVKGKQRLWRWTP